MKHRAFQANAFQATAFQVGEVTGTLVATLGAFTLAGTGTIVTKATHSTTLGAVALSGSAQSISKATLSRTLASAPFLGVGNVPVIATAAHTLSLALTAVGEFPSSGTLTQQLGGVTLEGKATQKGAASLSVVLQPVTLQSGAYTVLTGHVNQFLANVTLVGTAQVPNTAGLTATLDSTTCVGLGAQVNTYTLTQTLQPVRLVGIGIVHVTDASKRFGAGYALLDPVTVTSSAGTTVRGTAEMTLGSISITDEISVLATVRSVLSFDPMRLVVGSATAVATGTLDVVLADSPHLGVARLVVTGTAEATLQDMTLTSVASARALGTATPTLRDTTTIQETHGYVRVVGQGAATLGPVTLASDVNVFTVIGVYTKLEDLVLNSHTETTVVAGLTALLGALGLEGVASSPAQGPLDEVLDDLVGYGEVKYVVTARMASTLADATGELEADVLVTAQAVSMLDGLVLAASGGVIVDGTHTTQLDDVTLEGHAQGVVTGELVEVFPDMQFEGYMLHVRRTPHLKVRLNVRYVTAQVHVSVIYAMVKYDAISAHTTIEDEEKVA